MIKVIHGIDVSSNNYPVDFSKYHGTVFISKLTGGNNYWFKNNQIKQALQAGKLVGAYHYVSEYNKYNTVASEVNQFYKHFKPFINKVLPIIDYEVPLNSRTFNYNDIIKITYLARLFKSKSGVTPVIYCSKDLIYNNKISTWLKDNCMFWFAQYANNNVVGWVQNPWTDSHKLDVSVIGQQYTSHGNVKGTRGLVDLSVFYITRANWLKACKSHKV